MSQQNDHENPDPNQNANQGPNENQHEDENQNGLSVDEPPEHLVEALGPQVVIGGKRPEPVADPKDGDYLRCIGYLGVNMTSGYKRGTGTLITAGGGHGILTCAHVVYDMDAEGPAASAEFYAARSDADKPYGTISISADQIKIPRGYHRERHNKKARRRFDYAVIRLDGDIDPKLLPLPKLRRVDLSALERVQVTGYSKEAPPQPQRSMYYSQGAVEQDLSTDGLLYYKASTLSGASGSGVCRVLGDGGPELEYIRAVHTGGDEAEELNRGVYLTDEIIDWITRHIRR